jgi:hypothetical protein
MQRLADPGVLHEVVAGEQHHLAEYLSGTPDGIHER